MTKRQEYQEDRQYKDQKTKISGGQDNTMTKRQKYQEERQYNDQKTKISGGQPIQ
jgi:hypothetical protein